MCSFLCQFLAGDLHEVTAVVVVHLPAGGLEAFPRQPAHPVADLFQAGNLQALPLLDRLHEAGGLHEGIGSAGVEPGKAAAERLDPQGVLLEIDAVEIGDLEFATRARGERRGDVANPRVIEIEPRHGMMALRFLRLLLERHRPPRSVELNDAEPLRITDWIGKDRRPVVTVGRAAEDVLEAMAVEDVVAEDERGAGAPEELAADDERLGEPLGPRLLGIGKRHAKPAPVAEEALEVGQVVRRRDQEDVANPGQHERRERIINHRLVVDRQQLLRDRQRHRVEPRPRPTGQYDPLQRRLARRTAGGRRIGAGEDEAVVRRCVARGGHGATLGWEGTEGSLRIGRQGQALARWGRPPSMRNGEFSSDS